MEPKNRKALSWSVSLLIHATLLVLLLFVGFHFGVPEGIVTDTTNVEVVDENPSKEVSPPVSADTEQAPQTDESDTQPAAPVDASQDQATTPEVADTEAEAPPPRAERVDDQTDNHVTTPPIEPMDVEPKSDETTTENQQNTQDTDDQATEETPSPSTDQPQDSTGAVATPSLPSQGDGSSVPTLDESKLIELPGNSKPSYPWNARLRRQSGTVIIRAFIGKDGAVSTPSIQKSSGFQLLDEEALKSYSQWKYQPGPSGWAIKAFIFTLH